MGIPKTKTQLKLTNTNIFLNKWTAFNGGVLVFGALISFYFSTLFIIPFLASISLGILLINARNYIDQNQLFTYANGITLFRFILVSIVALFYASFNDWTLFFLLGFCVFLDGVDGWLARKFHQSSELGGLWDKITDAYFVLLLAFILIQAYQVPDWFYFIGLLHYLYEIVLYLLNWTNLVIPKNPIGKYVAAFLFLALISPFALPYHFYLPLLSLASVGIIISFSISFMFKLKVSLGNR